MVENLTVEEIKEIRGMYGLTQKSFAQLLGIGSASMVRYEQGATPSKANANLIRAARHPEFMRECLERDGELIPQRQRDAATRCVYALVSLEPEEPVSSAEPERLAASKKPSAAARSRKESGDKNMAMTMDEVYHYTIQQEVLNEQAANISCEMTEYMLARKIDINDEMNPVSILLRQLLMLKRELLTDEANDDVKLEQIRGHFKYMKQFIKQLNASAEVA